jgi:hypothetical protein
VATNEKISVVVEVKGDDKLSPVIDKAKREVADLQRQQRGPVSVASAGGSSTRVPPPSTGMPVPFQSDAVREARERARAEAQGLPWQSDRVRRLRDEARAEATSKEETTRAQALKAAQRVDAARRREDRERATGNRAIGDAVGLGGITSAMEEGRELRRTVDDRTRNMSPGARKAARAAVGAAGGFGGAMVGSAAGRAIGGEGAMGDVLSAVGGIAGGAAAGFAAGGPVGAAVGALSGLASVAVQAIGSHEAFKKSMGELANSVTHHAAVIREASRGEGFVSHSTFSSLPGHIREEIIRAEMTGGDPMAIARRHLETETSRPLTSISAESVAGMWGVSVGGPGHSLIAGAAGAEFAERTEREATLATLRRYIAHGGDASGAEAERRASMTSGFGGATSVSDSIMESLAATGAPAERTATAVEAMRDLLSTFFPGMRDGLRALTPGVS